MKLVFVSCLVLVACGATAPTMRFEPAAAVVRYTRLEGARKVGAAMQRRAADGTVTQESRDEEGNTVLEATLRLETDGTPATVAISEGGKPVEQGLADGSWRDNMRSGARTAGAYFLPTSWNELSIGLLARALAVDGDHTLALLPSGTATLERAGARVFSIAGRTEKVTQVLVRGVGRMPIPVWLDARGDLFAAVTEWESMVREGYEASVPALLAAQEEVLAARRASITSLAHPTASLVIRHARAFDPITLHVTDGTSIVIQRGRIVAVGPDAAIAAPAGSETLDAGGRFVMPGLWDNHAHLWDPSLPVLYVAAGVTTIREMGNTASLPTWVARIDAGAEIGPRILMARSVSKRGEPWWRANQEDADTVEEVEALVARSADQGYVQMKTRNIAPALVPALVRAAHARGMRVSGHVPAGMTPREFAEAGVDEIQHVGTLVRNGFFRAETPPLAPEVLRARVATALANHAPEVTEELDVYAKRRVAWDITALGATPTATKGEVPAEYQHLVGKGPIEHERAIPRGDGTTGNVRVADALLGELHHRGIVVVPGTDGVGLGGFELVAELERWVRAGIPAAEVLRLATYGSAKNMTRERDHGSLAVGSFGDVILLDGDPTTDITALRRVFRVVKGGTVYDPRALLGALGISP